MRYNVTRKRQVDSARRMNRVIGGDVLHVHLTDHRATQILSTRAQPSYYVTVSESQQYAPRHEAPFGEAFDTDEKLRWEAQASAKSTTAIPLSNFSRESHNACVGLRVHLSAKNIQRST